MPTLILYIYGKENNILTAHKENFNVYFSSKRLPYTTFDVLPHGLDRQRK